MTWVSIPFPFPWMSTLSNISKSFINDRGNALVATKLISRGSIIFTEKAAFVTQLPYTVETPKMMNDWDSYPFAIRACQQCFRSMEPVYSCQANSAETLPMPSLWPIPQYELGEQDETRFRKDKHGRLQCTQCHSLFCSSKCRDVHLSEMTSCCHCHKAMMTVVETLSKHGCQPDAVILAARIFCAMVTRYRTSPWDGIAKDDALQGVCGDASDLESLELGIPSRADDGGSIHFSLFPVYDALCSNVFDMTSQERNVFTLTMFSRLAAVSARNGFAIRTESPFRSYHSALLRAAGGRGNEQHHIWMNKVALALGSERLQRNMDRTVEDLVATQVVAIFSLTARINHSCDPNSEVRGQEYVDCYVDLVAKQDIQAGEEITISYINNEGRSSCTTSPHVRNRRIRELQSKYLFTCDCRRCTI